MTRRQMVLHLLREAGERGISTGELLQGGAGSRYGARLLELRAEGHVIETERIRDGAFRYTLTRDAGDVDVERGTGLDSASIPQSVGSSLGASPPDTLVPRAGEDSPASSPAPLFTVPAEVPRPGFFDYDNEEDAAA